MNLWDITKKDWDDTLLGLIASSDGGSLRAKLGTVNV